MHIYQKLVTLFVIVIAASTLSACKTVHTLIVDGMNREVIIYVPKSATDKNKIPVVFMLHGTTGTGEKFYNISGWREKADAEGFIAVFPTALTYCYKDDKNRDGDFNDPGEIRVTTKWANGNLGNPERLPLCTPDEIALLPDNKRKLADHPLMDDVAFINAVLDQLVADKRVDAKRIYASGFSNGAGMVSRLSLELSDRFAALSASAGSATSLSPQQIRPHSFVFTVGSDDPAFAQSFNVPSLPLDDTLFAQIPEFKIVVVDPMLLRLQLADIYQYQQTTRAGIIISHFTWPTSLISESNSYSTIIIEDLAHQYANGKNHPVVLADILWKFFKSQQLP
ncbi:MAG: hypothetical protein GXP08_02960 [Gammaproteobacteria bacterium]|nr:hypothetical protein [Gammaproteobacteria bacterium]